MKIISVFCNSSVLCAALRTPIISYHILACLDKYNLCVALSVSFPVVSNVWTSVGLNSAHYICFIYFVFIMLPFVALSCSRLMPSIGRDYRRAPYRGRQTLAAGEECGIEHHIPRHQVLSTPAEH